MPEEVPLPPATLSLSPQPLPSLSPSPSWPITGLTPTHHRRSMTPRLRLPLREYFRHHRSPPLFDASSPRVVPYTNIIFPFRGSTRSFNAHVAAYATTPLTTRELASLEHSAIFTFSSTNLSALSVSAHLPSSRAVHRSAHSPSLSITTSVALSDFTVSSSLIPPSPQTEPGLFVIALQEGDKTSLKPLSFVQVGRLLLLVE